MRKSELCPCGRNNCYSKCCGIIHKDQAMAKTAEDLMRSRYTAFTQANGDYLMQSHHPKTRKITDKKDIELWAKSVQWLKLEVLNSTEGTHVDNTGNVEFKAYYLENGQIQVIQENSSFVKENGCWYYVGIQS